MKQLALITLLLLVTLPAFAAGTPATVTPAQKDFLKAVQKGQTQRVKALIASGVDVNMSISGMVPLMLARDPEMVTLLAKAGADVNARSELLKQTVLQSAASSDSPALVRALIEAGADISLKYDNSGMDALSRAVFFDKTKNIKVLIDAGADPNDSQVLDLPLLIYATLGGKVDMMRALIKGGADVDGRNKEGATALMTAVSMRKADAAQLLIDAGADVNIRTYPKKGRRNKESNNGRSAMDMAKVSGDSEIVELLKSNGAKMSRKLPEPKVNKPNSPGIYSLPCSISGSPPPQGRKFSCSAIDQVADSGVETLTGSRAYFAGKHVVPMRERCQVDLGLPGFYTIRTTTVSTPWELVCRARLGTTTGAEKWIAFIRNKESVTKTSESKIVVKEPDKTSECPKTKPNNQNDDPSLEELNEALVTALKKFNKHATKAYTSVSRKTPGQFMLRISSEDCLLPNNEFISADCRQREMREGGENEKKYEGALRILVGSIQHANGKTRASVRIVNVETGEINKAGKGDADGTNKKATSDAIYRAIDKMGFKPSCTKFLGVTR